MSLYRLFAMLTGPMIVYYHLNHRSSWPEHPLGGFPRAAADGDGVSVLLHSDVRRPDSDVVIMMPTGLSNGFGKAFRGLSRLGDPVSVVAIEPR